MVRGSTWRNAIQFKYPSLSHWPLVIHQRKVFGIWVIYAACLGGSSLVPVFDAPWVPLFLGVIFLLHPALGLLATGAACCLLVLAILNEFITRKPLREAANAQLQAQADAEAAVRNADVVEAMGMLKTVTRRWAKHQKIAESKQAVAATRNDTIGAFSKLLRMLVQTGMLGLGAWLVIQQQLSPGGMVAGTNIAGSRTRAN